MALAAAFLSEDQFTCSICLDVFSNPVSTPCGHSFCLSCISSYWDGGEAKACQCPLCKESFRKRPELHINRTLKEITEQFKMMAEAGVAGGRGGGRGEEGPGGHPVPPPVPPRAIEMPGNLFAEMKTRFQRPANSVSRHTLPPPTNQGHTLPPPTNQDHTLPPPANQGHTLPPPTNQDHTLPPPTNQGHTLPPPTNQGHTLSPPTNQGHTLPPPTNQGHTLPPPPTNPRRTPPRRYTLSGPSETSPNAPLCPAHLHGLELFCRTDQMCVCSVCLATEHHGHNTIPAKREWHIRKSFCFCLQSQLSITETELKELISLRERKVEEIQASLLDIQTCAEREREGCVQVLSSLASCVERSQAEVLKAIETERCSAQDRAQTLLKELEEELAELRKKRDSLSQLAQTEDYVFFLKTFPTLSTPSNSKDWSEVCLNSELSSGLVLRTVNQMMERFQEELRRLTEIRFSPSSAYLPARKNTKVRRVQEYAAEITLDATTAHPRLLISKDNKQVRCSDRYQAAPDNPERFDRVVCVLAEQGFSSGRHYWEVEVGQKTDWDLGVASQSINRKGKITVSPAHGYWFLSLRDQTDYVFRAEPSTSLALSHKPTRIGIFLDCDKGQLSFYSVDAKLLIFTYMDNFKDAIHPFFSPCTNKSGMNEAPLVVCPVSLAD
ncbi:zinc finger protein RFP [Aplochiton taeniatus]